MTKEAVGTGFICYEVASTWEIFRILLYVIRILWFRIRDFGLIAVNQASTMRPKKKLRDELCLVIALMISPVGCKRSMMELKS